MSVRNRGWALFDAIIGSAPARTTNPWVSSVAGGPATYDPDYETLARLLAVPIHLKANSQSGVPALALDVWAAYEFRRAGFDPDAIWPRPRPPRVLPGEVALVLAALPSDLRNDISRRLQTGGLKGLPGASATILGKNYVKQVDVGMSSWRTGPELLISTKRMDSSFAKNAANRVEESYGDAKNLRLRHPRAALGFFYSLRSTALTTELDKADWLRDLLIKLGREDDAYDAVTLIVPEWDDSTPSTKTATAADSDEPPNENAFVAAGLDDEPIEDPTPDSDPAGQTTAQILDALPTVTLRTDAVPAELRPDRFFDVMIRKILDNCPINFHRTARERLRVSEPTN